MVRVIDLFFVKLTLTTILVGDVPAWFVQVLRQALDPMDRKMDKLTNDVQKLTNDIQTVKNEMQTVKNDIQTIKNHIQTVKNDIQTVQNDIQSMKQAQDHIRRISAIVSCNVLLYDNFF